MSTRTASLHTTETGLRIGIAHTPALAAIDRDHERLQTALLDKRTARPRPLPLRLLGKIWEAL